MDKYDGAIGTVLTLIIALAASATALSAHLNVYGFAKDFAGPIATIVAAGTAAYVTYSIQRKNYELASAKLRLDMFDKRYRSYAGTRDFLIMLMRNPDADAPENQSKISEYFIRMHEAEITCGSDAQAFCQTVRRAYERWAAAKYWQKNMSELPAAEKIQKLRLWHESVLEIHNLGDQVNSAFSADLQLER